MDMQTGEQNASKLNDLEVSREDDVCKEGNHVILDVNGEHQSLIRLKKGMTHRMSKNLYCSLDPILGSPYGSLFDIQSSTRDARLEKRQRVCEIAHEPWDSILDVKENNSKLNDAGNANQALSTEDIQKLKEEGKSGDEIIAALTQHSATFATKTQFSQEKYKKKKAKKYLQCLTLIRPCARSLTDYYFQKMPAKIHGMRSDTLAILLSLANISSQSRTLVVDGVGGLIAGAVIERMGGEGSVVNAYVGDKKPSQDIASCFNFPATFIKAIPVSFATLRDHLNSKETQEQEKGLLPNLEENIVEGRDNAHISSNIEGEEVEEETKVQSNIDKGNKEVSEPLAKKIKLDNGSAQGGDEEVKAEHDKLLEEKKAQMRGLCRQGFQSCIVASPNASPSAILEAVLPLLTPSASFSVFHPSAEPLAECLEFLKRSKSAIAIQLQESWCREYQVLPGRTHPTMATSGTGGYILSGIKIVS